MRARHAQEKGIEWRWADVRDMKDVGSDSVDVAFDKGTLDAMIHGSPWSPPDQVLSDTSRYMREVGSAPSLHPFRCVRSYIPCLAQVSYSFYDCYAIGPPRSQARRGFLVHHVPPAAFY